MLIIVAAAAAFFVRRAKKANAAMATHQLSVVVHNQAYTADGPTISEQSEMAEAIGRRGTQTQAPPGFATATPTVPIVPSRSRASTAAAAAAIQKEGGAVDYLEPFKKQMVKYDTEKVLRGTEYATIEGSAEDNDIFC